MQARKLAYVEERSQAARNPQPKDKTQGQRDLARQRPLPIRSSISESSTSAFLRDKNGYILAVSFSYLSSNPLASSHYEESLGASA